MCVCVVIPFILDVRLVDAPAGVTQEEGHTRFLIHLPSAVLAFIFIARRIQLFLSLVDREVNFVYPRTNRSPLVGKNPSYRDSNSRPNVRRFRGFQLNHRGDRLYRFVKPLFANLSYNTSSSIAIVLVVSMYRRNGCWTIFYHHFYFIHDLNIFFIDAHPILNPM